MLDGLSAQVDIKLAFPTMSDVGRLCAGNRPLTSLCMCACAGVCICRYPGKDEMQKKLPWP